MKKLRSVFIILICIILSSETAFMTVGAAEATEKFEGTRTVLFAGDKSDIENFIDGGRATFDIITRSAVPDWLICGIESNETELLLSLQFSFISYEDYTSKLYELLTYNPAIIYSEQEGLTLLESHIATDLLNSIQSILNAKNCVSEKNINELFSVTKNSITLNGTEYEFQNRISIRPDKIKLEKLQYLSVNTTAKTNGSFRRTIEVSVKNKKESTVTNIKKLLANGGKVSEKDSSGDTTTLSVSFESENQTELVKTTMLCLGIATSVIERQSFLSEDSVTVERCEFFDVDALLDDEAVFDYTYSLPDYAHSVSVDEEKYELSGSKLKAQNMSSVVCNYIRGIKFSKTELITDLSGFFGKIKRTARFSLPTDIAQLYHEQIKKSIEKNLIKGTHFNIYDSGTMRFYELTFSAFFDKDINEFSNEVLKSKGEFEYSDSWIPFGKSTLSETINLAKTVSDSVPSDETVIIYILPKAFLKVTENKDDKSMSVSGNTISFSSSTEKTVNLEFGRLDILKSIIELIPIIILLILILITVKKLKKKNKDKEKKTNKLG